MNRMPAYRLSAINMTDQYIDHLSESDKIKYCDKIVRAAEYDMIITTRIFNTLLSNIRREIGDASMIDPNLIEYLAERIEEYNDTIEDVSSQHLFAKEYVAQCAREGRVPEYDMDSDMGPRPIFEILDDMDLFRYVVRLGQEVKKTISKFVTYNSSELLRLSEGQQVQSDSDVDNNVPISSDSDSDY